MAALYAGSGRKSSSGEEPPKAAARCTIAFWPVDLGGGVSLADTASVPWRLSAFATDPSRLRLPGALCDFLREGQDPLKLQIAAAGIIVDFGNAFRRVPVSQNMQHPPH